MMTTIPNNKINNRQLIDIHKQRIGKLYAIYLNAMKLAFDEGNRYMQKTMTSGNKDFDSALRIRSYHIDKTAKKYEEFNIASLAKFFDVSVLEVKKATDTINN